MINDTSISRDVDEVQEVIQFYDQRGDGKISVGQVGNCLRALGLSPTEKQIEQLTQQWNDSESRISVEELTPIYSSLKKDNSYANSAHDSLAECMANYDREGNGNVSLQDLKYLLTNYGEPLSEEEAEILINLQDANINGKVNINEFIRLITS